MCGIACVFRSCVCLCVFVLVRVGYVSTYGVLYCASLVCVRDIWVEHLRSFEYLLSLWTQKRHLRTFIFLQVPGLMTGVEANKPTSLVVRKSAINIVNNTDSEWQSIWCLTAWAITPNKIEIGSGLVYHWYGRENPVTAPRDFHLGQQKSAHWQSFFQENTAPFRWIVSLVKDILRQSCWDRKAGWEIIWERVKGRYDIWETYFFYLFEKGNWPVESWNQTHSSSFWINW